MEAHDHKEIDDTHASFYSKIINSDIFYELFFSGSMPKSQKRLLKKYSNDHNKQKYFYLSLLVIDVILRGVAQVFLCNHPITGVFICIGIAFTSFELLGYALLAVAISTGSSLIIAKPYQANLLAGLCGYDGALVGCGCFAFIDRSLQQFCYHLPLE